MKTLSKKTITMILAGGTFLFAGAVNAQSHDVVEHINNTLITQQNNVVKNISTTVSNSINEQLARFTAEFEQQVMAKVTITNSKTNSQQTADEE